MLLALAYPDRVAQRRPGPDARYLLRSGQGAVFAEGEALGVAPYVVAAELGGLGQEPRITLAAAVDRDEVEAEFGDQIERAEEVWWDGEAGAVRARSVHRLGALVLREGPLPQADPAHTLRVILDAVRAEGLGILSTDPEDARTLDRVRFAATLETGWPDASDDALLRSLDDWLAPYLGGVRRRDELARLRPGELLLTGLDPRRRARLDALAPTHVAVPSGSRLRVDYSDPGAPALAVRLQEMFGAAETPRVGDGRVALTLRLLSPAHRPVQVTRDLAGFWRTSYFDVRKDLRGRYPKHHWPDDPLAAPPTARAKSYRRE